MGRPWFIGSMAFTPSGKAPFTALNSLYKGVNALFPDGVNAMLPLNLILATFLLSTSHLLAQPKAFASLQPERIETGDTSTLLILVSGLTIEPKEVDFSPWVSTFPAANIIGRSDWRKSGVQWTRRFTLIAFDSATLELPPLLVRINTGKPLITNELSLTVFPTRGGREIADMAKIRDIRREPISWMDYWPWGVGALALLGLMVWWLRKRRSKPQPVVMQAAPPPLLVSPSEKALQLLTQLQQKQLWKNGQMKEHYAEISLILREYLETRFGIAALESTTDEIQEMLSGTDFPPAMRPALKEFMLKTDMVKYAQSQPPAIEQDEVLEKARVLVSPSYLKTVAEQSSIGRTPQQLKKNIPPQKPKSGKYEPL